MPPIRSGVWLRIREPWTMLAGVFLLGMAVWMLTIAIVQIPQMRGAGSIGWVVVVDFFLLTLAAVFAFAAVRVFRLGLWIDSEGVVIRGYLRTSRVPLDQVDAFVVGSEEPGGGHGGALRTSYGVRLRCRDSRQLFVHAFHRADWSTSKRAESARKSWQPTCDKLNELVATLR